MWDLMGVNTNLIVCNAYLKNDLHILNNLPVHLMQPSVSNVLVCWSLEENIESLGVKLERSTRPHIIYLFKHSQMIDHVVYRVPM